MRTHCIHGHPFTLENTYTDPTSGKRRCVTCKNASRRRLYNSEARQAAYTESKAKQVQRALNSAYVWRNPTVRPPDWHSPIEAEWPLEITPELPWSCTPTGRLEARR